MDLFQVSINLYLIRFLLYFLYVCGTGNVYLHIFIYHISHLGLIVSPII